MDGEKEDGAIVFGIYYACVFASERCDERHEVRSKHQAQRARNEEVALANLIARITQPSSQRAQASVSPSTW